MINVTCGALKMQILRTCFAWTLVFWVRILSFLMCLDNSELRPAVSIPASLFWNL